MVAAAAVGLDYDAFAALSPREADAAVRARADATTAGAGLHGFGQRVVCPLVARHVDFLDDLVRGDRLPVSAAAFRTCVRSCGVSLLLGSAPVGPATVERLERIAGALPVVRFGSTETCLQVCGTPLGVAAATRLAAFKAGWAHAFEGAPATGYYVGRAHAPHTTVAVVRSVDADSADYLVPCADGEPGQIVTRGANVMTGYVGDDAATKKALDANGWYTNLGDVGFRLKNSVDAGADLYWLSRDSAMLIRGGANYAYEQINTDLTAWAATTFFRGDASAFELAVVGLKVDSEHEDSCCVTLELKSPAAIAAAPSVEADFLRRAAKAVSKGSRPDHLRLAPLPKNFKGVVLVKDLARDFKAHLGL